MSLQATRHDDYAPITRSGAGTAWRYEGSLTLTVRGVEETGRTETENPSVFVRFPDPGRDPWVAVERGYEIQINDDPARDPQTTAAVYGTQAPAGSASRPSGEWNHFRIRAVGREYTVWLNDVLVNHFVSADQRRGIEGHVGLQNHDADSVVDFRAIRVEPLG